MMRNSIRRFALAASTALIFVQPAALSARPGYTTGVSRPHLVSGVGADNISGRLNDWNYRFGADRTSNSYRAALEFAECVARFDPGASDRLLATPLGDIDDRSAMIRLARMNRGCVVESSMVAPVLLRAALAETSIRGRGAAPNVPVFAKTIVGVPGRVEGYPLSDVARCQLAFAPAEVAKLFATEPGAAAERAVAETLYGSVPQCGLTRGLGGIEPTVARIALVDAAYRPR